MKPPAATSQGTVDVGAVAETVARVLVQRHGFSGDYAHEVAEDIRRELALPTEQDYTTDTDDVVQRIEAQP